jgi:hypothetical protein
MYGYSCLFRYGDNHVGSSGLIYFDSVEKFEEWFKSSLQIRWAALANSETGAIVSTLSRPTPKYGQ